MDAFLPHFMQLILNKAASLMSSGVLPMAQPSNQLCLKQFYAADCTTREHEFCIG